jgi:hypothetical protein
VTNTWFPSKTSITVDARGRLILKMYSGDSMTVCQADVEEFVDAIVALAKDIKAMSASADADEEK